MQSKNSYTLPCALCDGNASVQDHCALSIQNCECRHSPIICHRCRSVHPKPPVPPDCRWCGQATTYNIESLKRNTFCADRSRICAIECRLRTWGKIREIQSESPFLKFIQQSWTGYCNLLVSDPSITADKILTLRLRLRSIFLQIFQSQMDFSKMGCYLHDPHHSSYVEMLFSRPIHNKPRVLSISRKMIFKLFEKDMPIGIPGLLTPPKFFHKFMMSIIRRILAKIAAE